MKELIIGADDKNQRLDKYLGKVFPDLPKSMMHKAIRKKKIKVNRKRAEFNQILKEGDQILLFLPDDALGLKTRKIQEFKPVDIVFENKDILVMNKPTGLLSQKDRPEDQDTLNDRLLSYLVQNGKFDPNSLSSFTPSILHRLDRNTSGLVMAAKSAEAARNYTEGIRNNLFEKKYLGVVSGKVQDGLREGWLKKEGTMAKYSSQPQEGYQKASMKVKTLAFDGNNSLVEFSLDTGRFHQIRAMMGHEGHPLRADRKYGSDVEGTYMLCAVSLKPLSEQFDLPFLQIKPEWKLSDSLNQALKTYFEK